MADAKKTENAEVEPAPKKSKKLLIIIIAVVLLLVIAGGAAAFFMMKSKAAADAADEEGDGADTKVEQVRHERRPDAPPVFVKLDPFTVKLRTEQQEAYLQATPELQVLDAEVGEQVKVYNPAIRHRLLLILSGKTASDVSTPEGVQLLANEMRVAINAIIEPPIPSRKKKAPEEPGDTAAPNDPVQAVLFTSFIVQ